jgi:Domain of unknown function (DUF4381)
VNSLLEQLHDIEGIDFISVWPLAIGWWILIGLAMVVLCAIAIFVVYRIRFNRSWKKDTFLKLSLLQKNLSESTARETVITLSEYLRRIALRRFKRNDCAGLVGDAWLKWLALHDPKKFDWEKRGTPLIEAPYAPMHAKLSVDQVNDLIQAVRNWVR